MPGRVVQRDSLIQVEVVLCEGLPIQLLQVHVMVYIDTQIGAGRYSPTGMLELFFVHVNRYICPHEVLQASGVVEMKVADYHRFDVLDVISRSFYGGRQLLCLAVFRSWKDICQRGAPRLHRRMNILPFLS